MTVWVTSASTSTSSVTSPGLAALPDLSRQVAGRMLLRRRLSSAGVFLFSRHEPRYPAVVDDSSTPSRKGPAGPEPAPPKASEHGRTRDSGRCLAAVPSSVIASAANPVELLVEQARLEGDGDGLATPTNSAPPRRWTMTWRWSASPSTTSGATPPARRWCSAAPRGLERGSDPLRLRRQRGPALRHRGRGRRGLVVSALRRRRAGGQCRAAYVFALSGETWAELAKLTAPTVSPATAAARRWPCSTGWSWSPARGPTARRGLTRARCWCSRSWRGLVRDGGPAGPDATAGISSVGAGGGGRAGAGRRPRARPRRRRRRSRLRLHRTAGAWSAVRSCSRHGGSRGTSSATPWPPTATPRPWRLAGGRLEVDTGAVFVFGLTGGQWSSRPSCSRIGAPGGRVRAQPGPPRGRLVAGRPAATRAANAGAVYLYDAAERPGASPSCPPRSPWLAGRSRSLAGGHRRRRAGRRSAGRRPGRGLRALHLFEESGGGGPRPGSSVPARRQGLVRVRRGGRRRHRPGGRSR